MILNCFPTTGGDAVEQSYPMIGRGRDSETIFYQMKVKVNNILQCTVHCSFQTTIDHCNIKRRDCYNGEGSEKIEVAGAR